MELIRRFFRYLAGHGAAVLAAMLLMVLAMWGFILLTDYVSAGKADPIDHRVIYYLRHHHGPNLVEEIMSDWTALGGPGVWLVFTAAVAGFLVIQRRWLWAAWMCCTIASGAVVTIFLKGTIDRVPPGFPSYLPKVGYYPSFPSGHAMMAAVAYLTLGTILSRMVHDRSGKIYILALGCFVTFIVGFSRVYLTIHWPTDVLAGWAAGLAWALLCWILTTRIQQVRQKQRDERRRARGFQPKMKET